MTHGFLVTRWKILNTGRGVLQKSESVIYGGLNFQLPEIAVIGG